MIWFKTSTMKKTIIVSFLLVIFLQSCSILRCDCDVSERHKVNEPFTISLENEGIGGYQWRYIPTEEVTAIDSTNVVVKTVNKLARYNKQYTLKGLKKGVYSLEFHYVRSFEQLDTIPENQKKYIKVKIKK